MRIVAVAAALLALGAAPPAALPQRPGSCAWTTVKWVGYRLGDGATHEPDRGSGSAISYADGGYQVDYDTVPAMTASRVGDRIMLCLVKLPRHCPPGDHRGKLYTATNLRTLGSWTALDAEHVCGGA